ncbi:MAG: YCF48-related protein [Candidatus Azobacteroides sp.]|nr:YCF48-related protein [Candidatus Azobacteroides sp.]
MKTKLYFIAIFLFAGIYAGQAQEQEWEYVCSLTGEGLCRVCTQGSDTVYVVGENGLIAKSVDKGITWDKKYFSGKVTLNDIIFCNHNIGFIVGNNGAILKTQDAGASWEQMISGTAQNINAIAAFDLNNLWVVGNEGLIMYSFDAGETWTTKPFLSDSRYFSDIKCKENRGYIAGQGGIILITEDGGTTWKEQFPFESLTEYDEIRSLCISDHKVYALANNLYMTGLGYIIFTDDNVNWHILDDTGRHYKIACYFQDEQKGFTASYVNTTCGDCGREFWIYKTIDGGNTWEEVYFNFLKNVNSTSSNFAFSSNNEFGYCILGKCLVRTPYTGEFDDCSNYDGINLIKISDSVPVLNQQGNELQVYSYSKMMDRVELISINGVKIMQKTERAKMLNINVSNLPKGIYLVNILFSDKTRYFDKLIKN